MTALDLAIYNQVPSPQAPPSPVQADAAPGVGDGGVDG